jgi:hypothetical protein
MAEFREARIEKLSPFSGDGVTRIFSTTSPYESGSLRVIVNGVIYPADDDCYGYVETSTTTIELNIAPLQGDHMQAFFRDEDSIFGGDQVSGSPFGPGEC